MRLAVLRGPRDLVLGTGTKPEPSRGEVLVEVAACSTPVVGSRADRPRIAGANDKLYALNGIEWWKQLEHAELLGIGSREYRLRHSR